MQKNLEIERRIEQNPDDYTNGSQQIGDNLSKYSNLKVSNPKSQAQKQVWERADAVLEIVKWMHLPEWMKRLAHLQPHRIMYLMAKAKKEGENPKALFKWLITQEK